MPTKKKADSRGSRRPGPWRSRLAFGFRCSIYILPLALLSLGAYYAYTSPSGGDYFALNRVDFDGLTRHCLQDLMEDAA